MTLDHANSMHQSWRMQAPLSVLGMGRCLPGPSISNEELLTAIDRNFGVDVRRRGAALARRLKIHARHLCRNLAERHELPRPSHSNAQLASAALREAMVAADVRPEDVSYLIAHTATPGQLVPPNASRIAEQINYDGPFLELRQACTGFANALVIAQGLIATQPRAIIAIVGSETGSVFFDPLRVRDDEGQLVNMMQMGDGAAACIVSGPRAETATISHVYFGQIGRSREPGFKLAAGGSDQPVGRLGFPEFEHDFTAVRESGPELFRCGAQAAGELGIEFRVIDRIVPHQANGRMSEVIAKLLEIDKSSVFVNADRIGNTGSAAIWLALAELSKSMRRGESALILGAEATKHMFGGFLYTR